MAGKKKSSRERSADAAENPSHIATNPGFTRHQGTRKVHDHNGKPVDGKSPARPDNPDE